MAKIIVGTDCGNAPKKIFLRDFNIAFAEGNVDFIAASVTDGIIWHMVGADRVEGKEAFMETLADMKSSDITEMSIHAIITHGREGSANGEFTLTNGTKYGFCDVYQFKGAKGAQIKSLTSYVIEINQ